MRSLVRRFLRQFRRVKVYALIGKSGTGKSFRARLVAQQHRIPLIIDDGLLIRGERIVAGKSAKNEPNYLAAIRTALFEDPAHRHEVGRALVKEKFQRILLVGTSEKMVRRITEQLHLPAVEQIIPIEAVASPTQIGEALASRTLGHHVIPVPFLEIKKDYGHLFADTIRVIFRRWIYRLFPKSFEKSVVKPAFQPPPDRPDHLSITPKAIKQMVEHCVDEFDHKLTVRKVLVRGKPPICKILLFLVVPYGVELTQRLLSLQNHVRSHLKRYTGLVVQEVSVEIDEVS